MSLGEKQTRKYGVSTAEKDETSSNVFSKLKDPTFRRKLLHWMWLPCGMFALGIVVSQGGPTILDLRIITGTDEETGSFFFTAISGGYLLGSFVAGGIHRKISNNLVMAVITILGGAATVATPYCSSLTEMVCVRIIVGFFLGGIDCCINAEHMRIWGIEGQALLQFVHFSFAIGGFIGPTFSAPFLAEKEKEKEMAAEQYLNVTQSTVIDLTDSKNSTLPQTTNIHYAYLIAGIILAVSSIPFIILLIFVKKSEADEGKLAETAQRKLPISVHLFLVTVLCAFYVAYTCVENTFSSFLETFLVDEYKDVTKEHAAYITSYFWAAFAAGRFCSIFTSKYLSAVRILYIQFCLMIIAYTGFTVSAFYESIDALTAFTCLIGVAMSSTYPSGFSWTEAEILKVTGNISGVILVGSSFGSMISPFFMGYLMQHISAFWFCYFLAGSVVITCLLFLLLLIFNRLYVNRKYGKFEQIMEQEKQVDIS